MRKYIVKNQELRRERTEYEQPTLFAYAYAPGGGESTLDRLKISLKGI